MKIQYTPLLRTRTAELHGYSELRGEIKESILPIFELTRSRPSKRNPGADCWKRLENIVEGHGSSPFILDLTSELDLQDQRIGDILGSPERGFERWIDFLLEVENLGLDVVPVIHFMEGEEGNVRKQIAKLSKKYEMIAFRVPFNDPSIMEYIKLIRSEEVNEKCLLLIDCGYVESRNLQIFSTNVRNLIGDKLFDKFEISILGSGFPPSVAPFGQVNGSIPLNEVLLNDLVKAGSSRKIIYGDYSSIHPIRFDGFGQWVPRIDFPLDRECYYYRFRRDDGSYEEAAKRILRDPRYKKISSTPTWGEKEISSAAKGDINGASPQYWISVRVNLHISRQYQRVSAEPKKK
jgi:hypothetical protein